ncbi:NUDIX hydrolase [Roseovarius sp.]|uniref:NUDIX hydrolase n=1 Tax=Roseovarius sp. TaxID=1486281 RepID=UPI00262A2420|nr:NUDIX hydrolase [Roseovarius sp.]MDM8167214.1 NUDIX hydrolase [Roseovarius sp.]
MTGDPERDFDGAKTILLLGGQLAVIRRDDIDGIAYPGQLDLPGGGREGVEGPEDCALRELREELGLRLSPTEISWRRFYTIPIRAWFFAAALPAERAAEVRFGNEGQGWFLMPPEDFAASAEAVPHFRPRVLEGVAALRI